MPKFFVLICAILAFGVSCENSAVSSEKSIQKDEFSQLFPNFPENPFLNLEFNNELIVVDMRLQQKGFETSMKQDLDWKNKKENIQFLLTDTEKLTNFRIVFFDKKVSFYTGLSTFLSENAKKMQVSEENQNFTCFDFESKMADYSVTMFYFDDNVRLHFKPSSWH